ncbi:MAG TPA: tyrosine-type recombinase/integrase, partial [Candidatus Spyradenecus faecavium]|nr:tyrosine-type recombinase/integrase [Candidatus Spyradenecus faecavium]
MTSSSPDAFAHDLDAFLDAAQYARGLSPATRQAYANALGTLLDDLRRRGVTDWAQVDAPLLADHLRRLQEGRGYAPATLAQHTAAIRALFGWLLDQGRIPASPLDALPPAKRPKRLPKTLPEGELNALIEAVDGDDPDSLRDRVALELLYGCGLRCAELIGLNLHDADLRAHTLRVHGKGDKERVVPYGPPAHAALLRWLQARKRFALTYKKGALAADLLAPRAPLLLS